MLRPSSAVNAQVVGMASMLHRLQPVISGSVTRSFFTAVVLFSASSAFAAADSLSSPDHRNQIDIATQDGKLSFTVSRDGRPILAPSPIGLMTSQGPLGGDDVEVQDTKPSSVDETFVPV